MNFFNLPFPVRISNSEHIDGDRYIAQDILQRDALVTNGRAAEGQKCYVVALQTEFQLRGGSTNNDWVDLSIGDNITIEGDTLEQLFVNIEQELTTISQSILIPQSVDLIGTGNADEYTVEMVFIDNLNQPVTITGQNPITIVGGVGTSTASNVSVADVNNNYVGQDAEAVFNEIAVLLAGFTPASITSIDLQQTSTINEFIVVITWVDGDGNTQTTTDSTPITITLEANLVSIQNTLGRFTGTNVQEVLEELYDLIQSGHKYNIENQGSITTTTADFSEDIKWKRVTGIRIGDDTTSNEVGRYLYVKNVTTSPIQITRSAGTTVLNGNSTIEADQTVKIVCIAPDTFDIVWNEVTTVPYTPPVYTEVQVTSVTTVLDIDDNLPLDFSTKDYTFRIPSSNAGDTVTLPDTSIETVPVGALFHIVNNTANDLVLQTQGTDSFQDPNFPTTIKAHTGISVRYTAQGNYEQYGTV